MDLKPREPVYTLPSYSLTADLLGYLRCGLQYRYTRIAQLPPSRPVQLWFGEFIHGVLEESFRRYASARAEGNNDLPPWDQDAIDEICELIKARLAARGLIAWNDVVEELGDRRASAAINELGPELFPLIHRAEVRLAGSRSIPKELIPEAFRGLREADRYEIIGVIDVITHVELSNPALAGNRIVQAIIEALPEEPPDQFEVIIDYKGMRRPPVEPGSGGANDYWSIYGWQVQTYAELRERQADSLPVVAAVLLYVNELVPTGTDLLKLRTETASNTTDVPPMAGSVVEGTVNSWRSKQPLPELPFDFRLQRALRIVPVTGSSRLDALERFDEVVARIETCIGRESFGGRVIPSWEKNASDEGTCAACDSRTFCPDFRPSSPEEKTPQLPRQRTR